MVESLPPQERRRFLKLLGLAMASPLIAPAVRAALSDDNGLAHAAMPPPASYFIEINLRDQWDHGHLMVAPGLATDSGLRRGENGRRAAMFYQQEQLLKQPNGVYLTPESVAIAPHLDHIALIETCELSKGAIHGHEAANALRSPGRDYNGSDTRLAMFKNDTSANFPQGCEAFYSSTPTPATLHNFFQKQNGLQNGLAIKGVSRSIHTVYHFAASLPGAELDRFYSRDSLLRAIGRSVSSQAILPNPKEAALFAGLLRRIDARVLKERGASEGLKASHDAELRAAESMLSAVTTKSVSLPLTQEETAYWQAGVPPQATDPSLVRAEIWEQVAYAYKLIASDVVRSIALEFDYVDVHDMRTADQMRTMTLQVALPLSRLIDKLKAANLFDRTLIAIYTTDGGRSVAANSSGNEGKNSVLLAGGMIRGGYFGDIRTAGDDSDGHKYAYHAPDPVTGLPGEGSIGNDLRLPGGAVWRTVAKALGIPDALATQFVDVVDHKPLAYLLR